MRGLMRALAVVAAVVAAAIVGMLAAVAAALVADAPTVLLGVGLAAEALVAWFALRWATRASTRQHRRLLGVGVAVLIIVSAMAVGIPHPRAGQPAPSVDGQMFWRLPTGSRIRITRLAATGPRRASPVVVLHGGPGVPDMPGDVSYFRPLTADGFDVYVYDQVGSGRSSRLTDPAGYGVDRDAADLEAVRRRIGADRLVLVAHSYGGAVAAHYLARHPDRVARMVLQSPHPPDPDDTSGAGVSGRLRPARKLRLYATLLTPRPLLGYALLQVNPDAAHAFFGDHEADARNDRVVTLTAPALHCSPDRTGPPVRGTGFYAMQYPQSATSPAPSDARAALDGLATPTLILKGQCDYLSWRSAIAYRDALANATLLYVRGAGHNIAQDRPAWMLTAVRAFLTDRSLPQGPYEGTRAPADYQGPP